MLRRSNAAAGSLDERGARGPRTLAVLATVALALIYLAAISGQNFVDPDVFHLMALAREALHLGRMPLEDRFAYTPTVYPSVQHEWGSGMLLLLLAKSAGSAGLLALKYALAAGIAGVCVACWRRSGARWSACLALAPAGALLVASGFSTVRPGVYTLLFTAVLMLGLEADRQGGRRWLAVWLASYVAWVNLHGGFVVGVLLFALHTGESFARRRPVRHLVLALGAMCLLVLVNPYGGRLAAALWHGWTLDRSLVTEWHSIAREDPALIATFVFSLAVVAYTALRRAWRSLEGWPLLAAAALAACSHQRHLPIYGVVWTCLAPQWCAGTPIVLALESARPSVRRVLAAACATVGLACALALARAEPWRLRVPADLAEPAPLLYPAGAVQFLREAAFEGNVMTPFTAGGYVSWSLSPRVRVSFDGRYEVAYPPGAARENRDFYGAREGWRKILEAAPTDLVLARADSAIAREVAEIGWWVCYRDDVYVLLARPNLEMPAADRRNQRVVSTFP